MGTRHKNLVIILAALWACGSPPAEAEHDPPADVSTDDLQTHYPQCTLSSGRPAVRLLFTGAWGTPVDAVPGALDNSEVHEEPGVGWVLSFPPGSADFGFEVAPAAESHQMENVSVEVLPGDSSPLLKPTTAGPGVTAFALPPSALTAGPWVTTPCSLPVLFVGLPHRWFADSGRRPALNHADFFLSGSQLFERLYDDLKQAQLTIHGATWWWQSDFELHRAKGQQPFMSADERWPNTALALLLANEHVYKRIIVARFTPDMLSGMAYVNTDSLLRLRAYDPSDQFEVLLQGNPTPTPLFDEFVPVEHPIAYEKRLFSANPEYQTWSFPGVESAQQALTTAQAASWHQKVWAIDSKIAYISGMNVKSTDWDTPEHAVFEPRRMKYLSSLAERQKVVDRLAFPDLGPRKDAGIRLAGPAGARIDDILGLRWDWGRAQGDLFAEYTTPFVAPAPPPEPADGIPSQIVATMPEPFGERSILETHRKAIRNATDLIYIEDQYFRAPMLLPDFEAALKNNPDLHIVVVTKPVSPLDGAKKWTVVMDEEMRKLAGDRYLLLQLKVFDGPGTADDASGPVLLPMDVHTKLVFVDDLYLTVGSANKNNRGFLFEGEMNAVVLSQAFVSQERAKVLANIAGNGLDWTQASGKEIAQHLETLATENHAIEQDIAAGIEPTSQPTGLVYPLEISPEYYIDAGPDAF